MPAAGLVLYYVHLIQPAPIDTDMIPKDGEFPLLHSLFIALERYGEPRDVAAEVSLPASDDAEFVTGAVWIVDGMTTDRPSHQNSPGVNAPTFLRMGCLHEPVVYHPRESVQRQ